MSSGRFGLHGRRGGGRRGGRDRSLVDSIREATGASVEDIQYQLHECEGDVNKATEQLIDCPFTLVQTKKPRSKPITRGRGRRMDGERGKHPPRGRGNSARNTHRQKDKPSGSVEGSNPAEKKKEVPVAPVPMKKAYLEALCGKLKTTEENEQQIKTAQQPGTDIGVESGWEEATPPPECSPMESTHTKEILDHTEEITPQVDQPTEEEKTVEEKIMEEVKVEVFPLAMEDIRFTRVDTTPVTGGCLPIPMRLDLKDSLVPRLDTDPLDMSKISYLFGTFAGLGTVLKEEEVEAVVESPSMLEKETPSPVPSSPAGQIEVAEETPKRKSEEPETTESFNLASVSTLQNADPEVETRPALASTSVDFRSEQTVPLTSGPTVSLNTSLSMEGYGPSTSPGEFRLDVGTQVLEMEIQSSPERSFLTAAVQSSPAVGGEDSNPHHHHHHLVGNENRQQEKTTPLPSSIPLLEETTDYTKPYRQELKSVDISNSEDLGSTFEANENRTVVPPPPPPPTHKGPSIVETKPMMEPEPTYSISSNPAPSIPSYQTQRHPSSHKIPDKTVQAVGNGINNHPAAKYTNHQGPTGVSSQNPTGLNSAPGNPNPANNAGNNSTNTSLPVMPQLPFLNPGMMPNPAMPFPPGHPYYPQFMQYQHQMYHGMYAGTYGGFGAPFNHESVGHPAHVNPPGVPPNQPNQQFPVSFPTPLYALGNTVYETANPNSFGNNKEKDNVFLAQQQQLPHGFPGAPQPVPRNDGSLFYGVPGQAFTQGVRNQYHQPPGFAGQFPGGGVVAPPHTYHPSGQLGSSFILK